MTPNGRLMSDGGKDDTDDGWDPEPAKLRDGETPDISGHAQRNIEQIKLAVEDGDMDADVGEAAIADIRERESGGEE